MHIRRLPGGNASAVLRHESEPCHVCRIKFFDIKLAGSRLQVKIMDRNISDGDLFTAHLDFSPPQRLLIGGRRIKSNAKIQINRPRAYFRPLDQHRTAMV